MGAREWKLDREEGLRLWGKQLEGRGERLMGWRQERWLLWLRWGGGKSKWEERLQTKMRSCHLGS